MKVLEVRAWLGCVLGLAALGTCATAWSADPSQQRERLAYIGTLDHKLVILDENKEAVVGEIPLNGVPRITVLSPDQTKIFIVNTKMTIEVVDLAQRKVTETLDLTDEHSRPRISAVARTWLNGANQTNRFSGIVSDPTGRYLYTTLRRIRKDSDEYELEAPKFVKIDLQTNRIVRSFDFPKEYDTGFGFMATFKVSPDGKYLFVFDEDIAIIDLDTFAIVDRIKLARPPFPGASPYHIMTTDEPYEGLKTVSSVFVSVDPIVRKATLGLATLDMETRKIDYSPIGPDLPMIGFMVAPDKKRGYSVMYTGASGNRLTEWWVWDLETHRVIKKAPFDSRPTFSFSISSDGKKLYLYGAGSTIEIFDAETLKSEKLLFINKDLTTRLMTLDYSR